jgi:anti-anti-sigma factor
MPRLNQQINVEAQQDVTCVRLQHKKMDEDALVQLSNELNELVDQGSRKVVLNLGPEDPIVLYSVFLAKLVSFQKRLRQAGGALKLAQVGPQTMEIFKVCRLVELFEFYPDQQAALATF